LDGRRRAMIRDAKSRLWTPWIERYVGWKLRRAFRGVWWDGPLPEGDRGLILYANHASFWDGFAAWALCHRAGRDGYALMEERNLSRYRFLSRLGAFSIRRNDSFSALESLRYCRKVLLRARSAVVVFPQGEMSSRPGPVVFERGVEVLARMSGVACVPVALRYAFFEHEYPDVLIRVGAAHAGEELAGMEERLNALVAGLGEAAGVEGFEPLIRGRRSVAQRWGAARGLT